jgi:hypothetical protein
MRVLALREEWLSNQGLPLDFQMRDKLERPAFLTWAKDLYHAEPYQRERQAADLADWGKKCQKSRMHSRWSREQQRRLGSTQMWTLVSFTGNCAPSFLKRAQTYTQDDTSVGAAQPAAWNTFAGKQARDKLRRGQNLARKAESGRHLKPWEQVWIRNEEDATMERDIGPNTRGG